MALRDSLACRPTTHRTAHLSNRMPCMPGLRCSRAANTWPTPPPTSATVPVAQGDQSNSCQAGSGSEAAQPSDCGFATLRQSCRHARGSSGWKQGNGTVAWRGSKASSADLPSFPAATTPAGWRACRWHWPPSWLHQSTPAAPCAAAGRGVGEVMHLRCQLQQYGAAHLGLCCDCPTLKLTAQHRLQWAAHTNLRQIEPAPKVQAAAVVKEGNAAGVRGQHRVGQLQAVQQQQELKRRAAAK